MSANYTSPKPDGYLKTRNNVYLQREHNQQIITYAEAGACRNLAPQSMANYGKIDYLSDVPDRLTKQK